MAWRLPTDPVTLAVLVFVAVFSVINWLRWRSKEAWLDRVILEQAASKPDDESEGERALEPANGDQREP